MSDLLERSARTAVAAAAAAAARDGVPQFSALRIRVAPHDALAVLAGADGAGRFYWERPEAKRSLAALGAAHAIEARGPERFREASRAAREVFAALHLAGAEGSRRSGAQLVGGFAFADAPSKAPQWRGFPPCRLVLPELLYIREGDDTWCTAVRRIEPGADVETEASALAARARDLEETPRAAAHAALGDGVGADESPPPSWIARSDRSHGAYLTGIRRALRDIAAGDLEKVVLARSVHLHRDAPLDIGSLLAALRAAHPGCTQFAVARGDAVFLGATPERLVRLEDGRVETTAVAGSAPRGRDPAEDTRLARELSESKKEQAEHAVVVRALRAALADVCEDLVVPQAPRLLRLSEIQHLATPITASLRNGASIIDLVERMHPTPAVGGSPRRAALEWIERHEDLERGWYAGPVGYVNAEGGGEFCVALRSAVLRGCDAQLFAGAGIVDGSKPQAELRETRLKLRTLLAPLLEI